jgi:uncharacterized membrane protein HdeD (DUF308 family)
VSGIFNIKRRLLMGGPVLIILGIVIYLLRTIDVALVLPVIGLVLIIAGVIYTPRKKTANTASETP